jgi:hypothetical protein
MFHDISTATALTHKQETNDNITGKQNSYI